MNHKQLTRRQLLRLGVLGLGATLSSCAGVTFESWPGVGATRSGPEAGCPPIMSHFDDTTKKYGQLVRTCCGWNVPHSGIDFDVSVDTPVLAVAPGVVTDIWDDSMQPEAGIFMVVYHGEDIDGKHVFSSYMHLSRRLKEPGDRVERGKVIALSGSTGTTFPHLHLSLFRTAAGPGPEFKQFLRRAWLRGARAAILADPGMYWADPKRPGFDPDKPYPDRPIRLTYPLACRR